MGKVDGDNAISVRALGQKTVPRGTMWGVDEHGIVFSSESEPDTRIVLPWSSVMAVYVRSESN